MKSFFLSSEADVDKLAIIRWLQGTNTDCSSSVTMATTGPVSLVEGGLQYICDTELVVCVCVCAV